MKIREKGSHTWDTQIHYHRCPNCGKILENRDPFIYRNNAYHKELVCCKCHHQFIENKACQSYFGPFFGESIKPEFEWL